ncbi:hypothetical protein B0H65DRAFT_531632 [Neurospora tetraspora]|uniref:Uncharacterized protein n=1 Tax=Neurospora tetraspora TaxID=94610 RepID=A0AAE0J9F1_9PEZI|nr:hypothetical protein B0H65DRAFT_531632 [Neurospora tetraspora]
MTDHNTDLRPSKRLRTEPETADRTSPSAKESIQPPPDFDLAALAGPESSNPYLPLLSPLPTSFHTTLLAYAATRDPLIASILTNEHAAHVARERARIVSFDHHSQRAWHLLNEKYSPFDVCSEIDGMFKKIAQAVDETSSFATKKNAVETMRQILESVCTAPDTLGEEVKNSYQARGEWDERLVELLARFQQVELERLARENEGEWFEELCSLRDSGASYGILKGLEEAVTMLSGYVTDIKGHGDEEEDI